MLSVEDMNGVAQAAARRAGHIAHVSALEALPLLHIAVAPSRLLCVGAARVDHIRGRPRVCRVFVHPRRVSKAGECFVPLYAMPPQAWQQLEPLCPAFPFLEDRSRRKRRLPACVCLPSYVCFRVARRLPTCLGHPAPQARCSGRPPVPEGK